MPTSCWLAGSLLMRIPHTPGCEPVTLNMTAKAPTRRTQHPEALLTAVVTNRLVGQLDVRPDPYTTVCQYARGRSTAHNPCKPPVPHDTPASSPRLIILQSFHQVSCYNSSNRPRAVLVYSLITHTAASGARRPAALRPRPATARTPLPRGVDTPADQPDCDRDRIHFTSLLPMIQLIHTPAAVGPVFHSCPIPRAQNR